MPRIHLYKFSCQSCYGSNQLRSRVFVLMLLLICSTSYAENNKTFRTLLPKSNNLNQYQWHSRPLVIFSPSGSDKSYLKQIALLKKDEAGLAERDVIVLSDTLPADMGQLRTQLQAKDFEVILFGKDGGMKLRQRKPISPEELFSTIDQMPMRRADLK
jgi:hypothetical protein